MHVKACAMWERERERVCPALLPHTSPAGRPFSRRSELTCNVTLQYLVVEKALGRELVEIAGGSDHVNPGLCRV